MELSEVIIERMKEVAEEHNMTIHQVIQNGRMNQATISELMNGCTKHPKVSTIQKFCNGVDISINKFFDSEKFKF